MASGGIPDRVRRLIGEHIHSVEQLEVLLLLKDAADREWTADEVAGELVTQRDSVAVRLEDLARRGFVAKEGDRYRYDGRDRERDAAVGDLAECYSKRRVSTISLIFSKPSDTIRTFADAFRLRGDG